MTLKISGKKFDVITFGSELKENDLGEKRKYFTFEVRDTPDKSKFKDGDFVSIDVGGNNNFSNDFKTRKLIGILRGKLSFGNDGFPFYAGIDMDEGLCINDSFGYPTYSSARQSSEDEKQELLNMLADAGKRWNADKKCVEDIPKEPQHKFKVGDKVRIKDGISSKTHGDIKPCFVSDMDRFIGKEMIIKGYTPMYGNVECNDIWQIFAEDWLEPLNGEIKVGNTVTARGI